MSGAALAMAGSRKDERPDVIDAKVGRDARSELADRLFLSVASPGEVVGGGGMAGVGRCG